MKKFKKFSTTMVAALALFVTSGVVNTGCLLFMHQPALPEGAEALYKE